MGARRITSCLCLVLFFVLSALPAAAQTVNGQISGFVLDPGGAAVNGATVVITDAGTKQQRTAQTDSSGYYSVANLPPSLYEISVEQTGFKKAIESNVKLDAADRKTVDISLQVGNVAESVTVTSSPVQLQESTAQVSRVIEGSQVRELVLNGRNPVFLSLTKAGVLGGNINDPNNPRFTPSDGGVNVNGSRGDQNSILLDGAQQVRTRSAGATTGVVDVDSLQEVQILTSNYAAEFGRAAGGQTIFVTKSGTKDFHGSVYEFFRNNVLDANTWSRNRTPVTAVNSVALHPQKIRFNQPGYSIGGPVFIPGHFNTDKSKLFFFFSQEFVRFVNASTNSINVPSLAVRQGDFSEFLPSVYLRDPQKTGACNATDQTACFSYQGRLNVIDPARLSKIGLAMLNAYPVPNVNPPFAGPINFVNEGSNVQNTSNTTLRMDYYQGKHHLAFRGSLFTWIIQSAFRTGLDFTPDNNTRPNRSGVLQFTSTFTPTLINDFTFGASADIVRLNVRGRPSRTAVGITYPYIFPGTKELEDKVPTITIPRYQTLDGGPYPASSSGPIYTWTDTLTHVRGAHTIKGGVNIEYSGQNDFDQVNIQAVPGATNNQNGRFEFSDTTANASNLGVANVALGLFQNYGELGRKAYTPWRARTFETFIQDNWKATQKLTLEYGVRYNYWPPWYSLWNNIATFRPEFYTPGLLAINTGLPGQPTNQPKGSVIVLGPDYTLARFNGMAIPGNGFPSEAIGRVQAADNPDYNKLFRGIPRNISQTSKNVLEPRLGVAYAYDDKTVVRAGFAIFHSRVLLNDSTLLGGNPPLQFQVGVSNGNVANPGGTITSFADQIRFPFIATAQDPVFKIPTAYNWSLTMQRELPGNFLIEVGYVGKRSLYLQRERNINSLQIGQDFVRDANGNITGRQPFPDALRPYQGYAQIRLSENTASAMYHSGQVTLNRRFSNGLSFDLAYTYSKSMDNGSDKRDVLPNPFSDKNQWGLSSFDRTHVLAFSYVYELPLGRGKRFLNGGIGGALLGGFQLSGITFLRSGTPFSIGIPIDALGVGTGNGNNLIQVAQLRCPVKQLTPKLGGQYFSDPSCFSLPAPGTEGNSGRDAWRNPRFQTHDLAIFRNFRIKENVNIQFRTEMFNFVNHPNLNGPDTSLGNAGIGQTFGSSNYGLFQQTNGTVNTRNFGLVTTKTDDHRTIQFGLKLLF